MFSLFESRYPECLALCLVVDAPLIFSTVWRVSFQKTKKQHNK